MQKITVIPRSDRSTENSQRSELRPKETEAITCLHLLSLIGKFLSKKESETPESVVIILVSYLHVLICLSCSHSYERY